MLFNNIFFNFNDAFAKITNLPSKLVDKLKVLFLYHSGKFWLVENTFLELLAAICNVWRAAEMVHS